MIDSVAVGKKIQECRIKNHYRQDDLADLLFVSRQAVSRWELGIALPTIDNLIELSRLFRLSFEELLCMDQEIEICQENIFQGHDRDFIVRKICSGELQVPLSEVFYQFSNRERMTILYALKKRRIPIDRDLRVKLTRGEREFLAHKDSSDEGGEK